MRASSTPLGSPRWQLLLLRSLLNSNTTDECRASTRALVVSSEALIKAFGPWGGMMRREEDADDDAENAEEERAEDAEEERAEEAE